MNLSNPCGVCLMLLALLALTGCETPASESPAAAQADLPAAASPAGTPLNERLGSALRSTDPAAVESVTVTSIDGIVLLTGQVLSEEAKSQASNTAAFAGRGEVLRLSNELRVVDAIDTSSAEQDEALKTSVESLLATNLPAPVTPMEIAVDNGQVYVLGRLSREQGDAATELLGRLRGAAGITTVFLYTD